MKPFLHKIRYAILLCLALCFSQFTIAQCNYDIEVTSDNLTIQGYVFNTENSGADVPQHLDWFLPATNTTFSTDPSFEFVASEYGPCNICLDYTVIQPDLSECSETICKLVTLANPTNCNASFSYEVYDGPEPIVGAFTFTNASEGPFTESSWNFGDGNYDFSSDASITHVFAESGSYEVRLSVWNGSPQDCYSEFVEVVEVIVPDDPCDQLDCVWPGDTNGDGAATLEDMINIGVGYGLSGPPRATTSNVWEPQIAIDWDTENSEGVDYKHFDCNGDGAININDIPAIHGNYVMLENGISNTNSDGVPISIKFDVDTVVITEEDQYLEINGGLYFGDDNTSMEDIYGVVLYLDYPKNYIVETAPVDFNYNENSFMGGMSEVLPLSRNIQEEGQTDIVITRKTGFNISGQGRVATVSFIIDADIIDGRAENEGEIFPVGINVVSAVNMNGDEMDVSLSQEPAGVFFQNGIISTKAVDLIEESKIQVYPNPANEMLQLKLSNDLRPESVEIFDLLGKRVIFAEMQNNELGINVSRLAEGIYILKATTEEGVGTKRIVIEK